MTTCVLRIPGALQGSIQNAAGPLSLGERLLAGFNLLCSRHRQRLALANLDVRLLNDIHISREQVRAEISKPLWRG